MDDVGLHLSARDPAGVRRFGQRLVTAMPTVLEVISFVGMLAMLWVGGHILLVGMDELGATAPYHLVRLLADPAAGIAGVGPLLGLLVGAVLVAVAHPARRRAGADDDDHTRTVN